MVTGGLSGSFLLFTSPMCEILLIYKSDFKEGAKTHFHIKYQISNIGFLIISNKKIIFLKKAVSQRAKLLNYN